MPKTTAAQARRRIAAARKKLDRARGDEATALAALGKALADAPKPPKGGKVPADTITVDELAKLAGVKSRQAVYDLIGRAALAEDVKAGTGEARKPRTGR